MLATQIVEVNNGAILRYPGKYEEYVYSMDTKIRDELKEDEIIKPKPAINKSENKINYKADRNALRHLKVEKTRLNFQIREIHERCERHKKEWGEIHKSFSSDPISWSRERYSRYEYLKKTIKEEEDLWLELTEKTEGITKRIDEYYTRISRKQ